MDLHDVLSAIIFQHTSEVAILSGAKPAAFIASSLTCNTIPRGSVYHGESHCGPTRSAHVRGFAVPEFLSFRSAPRLSVHVIGSSSRYVKMDMVRSSSGSNAKMVLLMNCSLLRQSD